MKKIFKLYFFKRTLVQILLDIGLLVSTAWLSVAFQLVEPGSVSSFVVSMAMVLAVGILLVHASLGFYQQMVGRPLAQRWFRTLLSLCLSLALAYCIYVLSPLHLQDERTFAVVLSAGVVMMLLYRTHGDKVAVPVRRKVLVYGSGPRALLVGHTLKSADPMISLVGYFTCPHESNLAVAELAPVFSQQTLAEVVKQERVDEIVVAISDRRGGSMPLRALLDCKLMGIAVLDFPSYFENALGQIRLDAVSAGWLVFGGGFRQGQLRTLVKRGFDIASASVLLALTWPLMLLTALLVRLESRGPVFYAQERVGLNGQVFKVVKFRSMRADAEKDGQPVWASAQDPRITRVGRVIRKMRIDELPQLLAVLGGTMSLVGPRPERPHFVKQLTQDLSFYDVRHSVKPGITGWAQVRYHYGACVEDAAEKLQYDLYYVKNHSLLLDVMVLYETVGVVLMGKGAH